MTEKSSGKQRKGPPHGVRADGRPRRASFSRKSLRPLENDAEDGALLYGWHAVSEALANPRRAFRTLLATENAARRLSEVFHNLPIAPTLVRPDEIDRRVGADAVHQGLLLHAESLPALTVEDLARDSFILVLDQITDPHNVGAIVRTACAFGVDAILTTARHSPAATGVLAKSASGGLEHVPFVTVRNLAGALQTLSERGFLCIGLDSEGAEPLADIPVRRPLALVLGAEGKGLRQLTRERCNVLARLDVPGKIKSLNVSNAAAIALYAVTSRLGAPTA
ncbi:23S rRNA (guanosine2251-2'-O)-methyltransferase [Pseudochelatococcus lubricantis]|uniref:23S rRNA (Guanosine2251-2'-O)-methyltransferase n=1 Tax=Pseudochelatococcus lubricantis TaxID=1538102 RepID=A0ABX0UWR3_9HYPH|nr:23S rRNA (guanosine(2251)-2'-O)-methyltransferase RlmB [Pseudochelatococcus lubricantis]NIJ57379.1 23S rRNA (guanosine2251-2'-O)-methyltransferase [Pseudochelatococcus lubricantis]